MQYKHFAPSYGSIRNNGDLTASCISANQYYDFTGSFIDGDMKNFTLVSSVFTCQQTACYKFSGNASVKGDKACRTIFGLFLNSNLTAVAGCESPAYLGHADKEGVQVCSKMIHLDAGDTIKVKVQTDEPTVAVTVTHFNISFVRES